MDSSVSSLLPHDLCHGRSSSHWLLAVSDHTIVIIWVVKIFFFFGEDLFCTVLLCILATSSSYLLLLLGPYHSVLYRAHLCMKCSLGISNFLEEISSLSHSFVFLYFFSLIAEEGFLISSCCSLELCIQMFISFLFSFAFHFSSFHSYL